MDPDSPIVQSVSTDGSSADDMTEGNSHGGEDLEDKKSSGIAYEKKGTSISKEVGNHSAPEVEKDPSVPKVDVDKQDKEPILSEILAEIESFQTTQRNGEEARACSDQRNNWVAGYSRFDGHAECIFRQHRAKLVQQD